MPNANWANPTLASTYTSFVSEVKARDEDLALQFDGTTATAFPTGTIRWDSSANRWKKWSGTAWGELATTYALTALSTTGNASIGGTLSTTGNAVVGGTLTVTGATTFTGIPSAPTAAAGTSTTQLATTAFVQTKAALASPAFTGTPTGPTAAAGTNSTQLATTAFVATKVTGLASLSGGTFTGFVSLPSSSQVTAALATEFRIVSTAASSWQTRLQFCSGSTAKWELGSDISGAGDNNLYFYDNIAAKERARINSSGYLRASSDATYYDVDSANVYGRSHQLNTHQNYPPLLLRNSSASSTVTAGEWWHVGPNGTGVFCVFNKNQVGQYIAAAGGSWVTSSDERLKNIIEPISDALEKVSSLRSVIGTYKADPGGARHAFLIAQDVVAVLPEAVDAESSQDGTMGVRYTDVIPLLVAALKEATGRIEDLEARLAAFDA